MPPASRSSRAARRCAGRRLTASDVWIAPEIRRERSPKSCSPVPVVGRDLGRSRIRDDGRVAAGRLPPGGRARLPSGSKAGHARPRRRRRRLRTDGRCADGLRDPVRPPRPGSLRNDDAGRRAPAEPVLEPSELVDKNTVDGSAATCRRGATDGGQSSESATSIAGGAKGERGRRPGTRLSRNAAPPAGGRRMRRGCLPEPGASDSSRARVRTVTSRRAAPQLRSGREDTALRGELPVMAAPDRMECLVTARSRPIAAWRPTVQCISHG